MNSRSYSNLLIQSMVSLVNLHFPYVSSYVCREEIRFTTTLTQDYEHLFPDEVWWRGSGGGGGGSDRGNAGDGYGGTGGRGLGGTSGFLT